MLKNFINYINFVCLLKYKIVTTETDNISNKSRSRLAVTLYSIAQGFIFATWASRLPDISSEFGMTDVLSYGALMFMLPVGKFLAIPIVGYLFPRFGSKVTVLISIMLFALTLPLIALIPINFVLLGSLVFIFGIAWNMTDISLNTQAIEVEKIYKRPIIASFHASWSFAAVIGALVGYLMYNLEISIQYHFIGASLFGVIIILSMYKYLLDVSQVVIDNDVKEEKEEIHGIWYMVKHRIKPDKILISLGIIWLCVLIVENTMFEWSDKYFEDVMDVAPRLRIGFLIFMTMMFVGRMITSFVYTLLPKYKVVMYAGLLIFLGFLSCSFIIDLIPDSSLKVLVSCLGFVCIGLGTSCIVPTLYSIVAEKSKIPVGIALTLMSSISFAGPLLQPIIVAGVGRLLNLQWSYFIVGLVGLVISWLVATNKEIKN